MTSSKTHLAGRALMLPFVALLFAALHGSACLGTAECDALRERLLAERATWDACDPTHGDDDCVLVGGQDSDCTGVLRCPIPVHRGHREDAARAVIGVTSSSAKCDPVCSRPTCGSADKAQCDGATRRCVVRFEPPAAVTPELRDAGLASGGELPPPEGSTDAAADGGALGL